MWERWIIGMALSFFITTVFAEADLPTPAEKDTHQPCKTSVFTPRLCQTTEERQEAERVRRKRLEECCLTSVREDGTFEVISCPITCAHRRPE